MDDTRELHDVPYSNNENSAALHKVDKILEESASKTLKYSSIINLIKKGGFMPLLSPLLGALGGGR